MKLLMNVCTCLHVGTLTDCPLRSNEDEEFPARWCFIFFYPPWTSREIGWERRHLLSSRSKFSQSAKHWILIILTYSLSCEIKSAPTTWYFRAQTRYVRGCLLNANIIKFLPYRILIYCHPPCMSRETLVEMSMAFSLSKIFYRMYQACMWSCSLDLLLLPGLWPPHHLL